MTINKNIEIPNKPSEKYSVSKTFGIDSKLIVKGFKEKSDWVPDIDNDYVFINKMTRSEDLLWNVGWTLA